MKLRLSNGKDHETTFSASDIGEFTREFTAALRVFRAATQHRVHRSEIRKTVSEFEPCELHVADAMGKWYGLGTIKSTGKHSFFEPFTIRFSSRADSLDAMNENDSALLTRNRKLFWQGAVDSFRWAAACGNMVAEIGDKLN